MKKIYKTVILSICLLVAPNTFAALHNVTVNASNFSPSTMNVNVGDTIIWSLGSGFHTTTSLTIPAGATPWNSDINPGIPFFAYQVLVEGVYDYECTPHGFVGNFTAINTGIETPEVNNNFKIYAVQPSIYNLSFTLTHSADVKVIVYDLTGKSAKVLASSLYTAGEYLNTYNLEELRKGIYLIEMRIDNQRISKRLIID